MTAKFAVGDTVIHVRPSYHRGRDRSVEERTIRKVGRKYAYLEGPWHVEKVRFSLEDGIEHPTGGNGNYPDRIWTSADWAAKKHREKVRADLTEAGIAFKGYGEPPYDTETLEKLLMVVQASLDSKRTVAVL